MSDPVGYTWKSSNRISSRGYGVGDVRAWIRDVQIAAGDSSRRQIDAEDDDSHREANELLSAWMAKKAANIPDDDVDDEVESPWQRASSWQPNNDYDDEDDVTVESVLSRMRSVPIETMVRNHRPVSALSKRKADPVVTMEMRHKQVKERREEREKMRRKRLEANASKKELRIKAELMLKREEDDKMAAVKREEALVEREVERLRRELKVEKRSQTDELERLRKKRESEAMERRRREAIERAKREENRSDERERQNETKRILMEQLEEAKLNEEKHNLKLLKSSFSSWYSLIIKRRLQFGRARALSDWRSLARAWTAWRRFSQSQREDKETRDMTSQIRRMQTAIARDRRRILAKCFEAWARWNEKRKEKKEMKKIVEIHRKKMANLLAAAAEGKLFKKEEKKEAISRISISNRNSSESEGEGDKERENIAFVPTPKEESKTEKETIHHTELTESVKRVPTTSVTLVTTKLARERIAELEDAPLPKQPSFVRPAFPLLPRVPSLERVLAGPKRAERGASLPVRPSGPKGMEERAALIAERREARMEKIRQAEEEKLARLKGEEEERKRKEEEEKMAKIEKRREERKLAKQREEEKQKRLELLARQIGRAEEHYQLTLMKRHGLLPWKRLIELRRENETKAIHCSKRLLLEKCFSPWQRVARAEAEKREREADSLFKDILLKRYFKLWIEYMTIEFGLEAAADRHCEEGLKRKYLHMWQYFVTSEHVEAMRKEERAQDFYAKSLKRVSIRTWIDFVPWSKREKQAEKRRAILRRKVADWLPDFEPTRL